MRKTVAFAIALLSLALPVGIHARREAAARAKEVAVNQGSFQVRASGLLGTTVAVYDGNRIANAAFDYDLVENHREALLQLGFSGVHVETATGQTLDRPL